MSTPFSVGQGRPLPGLPPRVPAFHTNAATARPAGAGGSAVHRGLRHARFHRSQGGAGRAVKRAVLMAQPRSLARLWRRCARAADGRAVRSEPALVEDARHHRFAAVPHAVAGRVGTARSDVAMTPARIAARRRAPVPRILAARHRLRGDRSRDEHLAGERERQQGKSEACDSHGRFHGEHPDMGPLDTRSAAKFWSKRSLLVLC